MFRGNCARCFDPPYRRAFIPEPEKTSSSGKKCPVQRNTRTGQNIYTLDPCIVTETSKLRASSLVTELADWRSDTVSHLKTTAASPDIATMPALIPSLYKKETLAMFLRSAP